MGSEIPLLYEAKTEGFVTVEGWLSWYPEHGIDLEKTYRIGFRKID